jgi:protein associated with RNAse G/E
MNLVHIDMRKWRDHLHWQFDAHMIGKDKHGTWLHVPSDTIVKRGTGPSRPLGIGFVGLVPNDRWWVVEFYTSHPWHAVYVNIGTPPVWDGERVHQVDLDLDVVRKVDGSIVVLDEDEFAEHQARYSYPVDLINGARTAATEAVGHLQRREEPFGSASDAWIAQVDPATLRQLTNRQLNRDQGSA